MIRNLLIAAVIGATAAGVGTLYAATEPVQGTAHAAIVQSAYGDAPCASETDNEDAWQACKAADTAAAASAVAARDDYAGYCHDAALAEHEYVDDADDLAAGKQCAARFILERIYSGQHIYEDWTWQGMPPVVDEFANALQLEADATDVDDETYLAHATVGHFPLRARTVV